MPAQSRSFHQSFMALVRWRYAVGPLLLVGGCVMAYAMRPPNQQARGDTWLGYTLGTIAASLILILMLYGVRRRIFGVRVGHASGWLLTHVYLGIGAVLIATLHCGLHFGRNVHTLAYGLMCLVVASGCWGVYAYLRYPALLVKVRANASRDQLLAQITELDRQTMSLVADLSQELREFVIDAIRRTRIGGGFWTQLRARDESCLLLCPPLHPGLAQVVGNVHQKACVEVLSRQYAKVNDAPTRLKLEKLVKVIGSKGAVQRRLQHDLQLQGLLQFWLYLHLPLSFGLLAALSIHIFAVFFYR